MEAHEFVFSYVRASTVLQVFFVLFFEPISRGAERDRWDSLNYRTRLQDKIHVCMLNKLTAASAVSSVIDQHVLYWNSYVKFKKKK
jgi:hypothetical protein